MYIVYIIIILHLTIYGLIVYFINGVVVRIHYALTQLLDQDFNRIFMRLFFVCLFLVQAFTSFAAWNNVVDNFDNNTIGYGSHTWQICTYDDKWIYFANNAGLLEYNDNSWNILKSLHIEGSRSVMHSSKTNRIYTGEFSYFGFYSVDNNGNYQYTSLSDSLSEPFKQNIWNIKEADNVVYFQADRSVVKYVNGDLFVIDINNRITSSQIIYGSLFLGLSDGLYMLAGRNIMKQEGFAINGSNIIRSIYDYDDHILISCSDGVYLYDPIRKESRKMDLTINRQLKDDVIFSSAIRGNMLALGTVQGGVYLYDLSDDTYIHINNTNGLQSNTVLSLAFTDEHLWVGQDGGIDRISLDESLRCLNTNNMSVGTGYCAQMKDDLLYLGTNRGLYCLQNPLDASPRLTPIKNAKGQVWNIAKLGDDVFSMQDRGLFLLNQGEATPIAKMSNVRAIAALPNTDNKKAIVNANGKLLVIEKSGGVWCKSHSIDEYNGDFASMFFVNDDELWFSTIEDVGRIRLDKDYTNVVSRVYYPLENKKAARISSLNIINGDICAISDNAIYSFSHNRRMFVRTTNSNIKLSDNRVITNMLSYGDSIVLVGQEFVSVGTRGGKYQTIYLGDKVKISPYAKVIAIDSLLLLPQNRGFSILDINKSLGKIDKFKVSVNRLYSTEPKDTVLYSRNSFSDRPAIELPYKLNSLRFECGNTENNNSNSGVLYRYRLGNKEPWSEPTTRMTKEYGNIRSGNHTFYVQAIFFDGTEAIDELQIRILPPWYFSNWAFLLYMILLIFLILFFVRLIHKYAERQQKIIIAHKDKELEDQQEEFGRQISLQADIISQLEKEKIELDLKHKSQELANVMINSENQNATFIKVKDGLTKIRRMVKTEKPEKVIEMIDQINSQLDTKTTSEQIKKKIESEFDFAQNKVLSKLEKNHPDLSYNERLMCAYIKMGLSSKEIAPMLNISTRGVETLRYRIRKKFNLERGESLTCHLNNLLGV